MLQQTRVAVVVERYQAFMEKFPTVFALAAGTEQDVLALWSGLGYYRRARMLHKAAKVVASVHRGVMPATAAELLSLPGVGSYTAAAVASIAFGEPIAVVDGNVERVLCRLAGWDANGGHTRKVERLAARLVDEKRPGDFNQAMMELGATVCLPRAPQCLLCPLRGLCATRGELKEVTTTSRQKKREIRFGLARRGSDVFLVQRGKEESLMPGMWELPEYCGNGEGRELVSLRHSITVTDYKVRVMELMDPGPPHGRWVAASRLSALPLTGLARKILRRVELL